MQLFAPDIMEEVRGLSLSLCIAGFLMGLVMWLTGWWGHRFWIVLSATVTAGIGGMVSAPASRVQPVLTGLLLALAAGMLALALVRLIAFGAGGIASWLAVHALAPAGWDNPLLCFLIGGLAGLVLFRVWMMLLTSLGGSLLMGYFSLNLADAFWHVNSLNVTRQQSTMLNWACGACTLVGLIVQIIIDRRRMRNQKLREEEEYRASLAFRQGRSWSLTRWSSRRAI